MEKHKETIECPECGKRQTAEVLHTLPWWSYVHNCVSCRYTIMESEWSCIDTEEEMEIKEADKTVQDLEKAKWYLEREIYKLKTPTK
jgi:ssDNA-binding Zn-finger/Zn-ribbon topoisomerase 1